MAFHEQMRRAVVVVAVMVALTGCGSAPAGAVASPAASPSPSGTSSTPPSPSPAYAGLWPRSTNLAYDSTRKNVVLFGGIYNRSSLMQDTWTWDGHAWTQQHPAHSPSGRHGAALVDDPEMHAVLLFGGNQGGGAGEQDDTWAWNGVDWTRQAPGHSPPAREGAAMSFDPVRHNVLLFGGMGLGDTWTWNGQDWTQAQPAQSPPARGYGRLAVNTAHGEAVLFGGFEALRDTWTWDGVTWTQQHPTNSPPNPNQVIAETAQMVYDETHQVIVFAGPDQSSGSIETFTWDGTDWTPLNPPVKPSARDGAGLAYDAADGVTILAGGLDFGALHDLTPTWGWDGTSWTKIG